MNHGYQIEAKETSTEILIYDSIGDWWEGVTAKNFVSELNDIKTPIINLRINSDGGNVNEGLAIYNALRKKKAKVEVDIEGIAASIASVIAMAGDEIRMAESAVLMIHDPWMMTAGTADELRKAAETMDMYKDNLIDIYNAKTALGTQAISDMMAEETFMTAEMAYEKGFIDAITEQLDVAAKLHPGKHKKALADLGIAVPGNVEEGDTRETILQKAVSDEPLIDLDWERYHKEQKAHIDTVLRGMQL